MSVCPCSALMGAPASDKSPSDERRPFDLSGQSLWHRRSAGAPPPAAGVSKPEPARSAGQLMKQRDRVGDTPGREADAPRHIHVDGERRSASPFARRAGPSSGVGP